MNIKHIFLSGLLLIGCINQSVIQAASWEPFLFFAAASSGTIILGIWNNHKNEALVKKARKLSNKLQSANTKAPLKKTLLDHLAPDTESAYPRSIPSRCRSVKRELEKTIDGLSWIAKDERSPRRSEAQQILPFLQTAYQKFLIDAHEDLNYSLWNSQAATLGRAACAMLGYKIKADAIETNLPRNLRKQ